MNQVEVSSLSGREVAFNEEIHSPSRTVDPLEQQQQRQLIEALFDLAEVPANCTRCGKRLPGDVRQKRITVVVHDGENALPCALVFCPGCLDLPSTPTPASEFDVELLHLYSTGVTQEQVAAKLSVRYHRKVSKSEIQRRLAKMRQ